MEAIKEKIDIYSEEIERITNQISVCQKELDDCMETEEVPIEALLILRQEMEGAKDADSRIKEIDAELKNLSDKLEIKNAISELSLIHI